MKKEFLDIFSEGLGKCTKTKVKLPVKENVMPVFKQKRNVSYAAMNLMNQELDRFEKIGVISKVQYSKWAAPMVYIKKTDKYMCVCGFLDRCE